MLYKALNSLSPYANTFKPAVTTSLVHNSGTVSLSEQQQQQNYQNNSSPYHHQFNICITTTTANQSPHNKTENKNHYYNSDKKRHKKKYHCYRRQQHGQEQLEDYHYNTNNPIDCHNPHINYQASREILRTLHASSNGVTTIPEWEHDWLQHRYILPPPPANNAISMLAPDKFTYWHYFRQLVRQKQQKQPYYQEQASKVITSATTHNVPLPYVVSPASIMGYSPGPSPNIVVRQQLPIIPAPIMAPTVSSLLPPPPSPPSHTVPLKPDMHYPPLPLPLNMAVSQQQQQQHQQPDSAPPLYQLPRHSNRPISIVNPTTREQVTVDPIIVKPASIAIRIEKPPVLEVLKEKVHHPVLVAVKDNNATNENFCPPAPTINKKSITSATTSITKGQQKQQRIPFIDNNKREKHPSATILGVDSSNDNDDNKPDESLIETTTNNEQQQSTATSVNFDSSNKEEALATMNKSNKINMPIITKETRKLTGTNDTSSDETEEECSDDYDDNATTASTVSATDNKELCDNEPLTTRTTTATTKQRIQYSREFLLQFRHRPTETNIMDDLSAIQPVTSPVLAPIKRSTPPRKNDSSFIFNTGYIKNNHPMNITMQQQQRQTALFTTATDQQPWHFDYKDKEQQNKYYKQDVTRCQSTMLSTSLNRWAPPHELRKKRQHGKATENKAPKEKQYMLSRSETRWIAPCRLRKNGLAEQNKDKTFTTPTNVRQLDVLPKSTHRWVPQREIRENNKRSEKKREQKEEKTSDKVEQDKKQKQEQLLSIQEIERKVKGLLNKLSPVNFDSISEQIWDYAKESTDNVKLVVRMIFDKACDEPNFATNWAKLCKKLQDILSATPSFNTIIQDHTIKDKQGKPASGAYLYRCYLLNRCQKQFETGWWSNSQESSLKNVEMLSDQYYAAMKQKRQGLGLVVFIGELYKQDMLTNKTVGYCLSKLVEDKECVGDEEVETVCKLLLTIGESFDQVIQTRFWMNQYLQDMEKMIMTNKNLSTRVKFKVMDVLDLRKNQWILKKKL